MPEYVITAWLDTRRKKKGNTSKKKKPAPESTPHEAEEKKSKDIYPLKLRVYYDYKTRLFPTGINLTEDQFRQSYQSEKPKGEDNKNLKLKIQSLVGRADAIAGELKTFDFDKFEKRLLRTSNSGSDLFYHYRQKIAQLQTEDRVKTASNYDLSAKSLVNFLKSKGKKTTTLPFEAVNKKFLNDYERWMQSEGKELTTVGIYLRPLRAIFNEAIREGEIEKDLYPFKRGEFEIPAGSNIKKALNKADLKKLFTQEIPEHSLMIKARDFWFFSFQCNGINIRDICELKYKNVGKDSITFIRTKTKRTSKKNLKPIIAPLTPFVQGIIEKYGSKPKTQDGYVFPVFTSNMGAGEKVRAAQAFTRYINQHMKRLAKLAGVDEGISTYYARHSFTTISVLNGASLEFIQDSLGHSSINTTMNYWAGFNEEVRKENASKLMDFE